MTSHSDVAFKPHKGKQTEFLKSSASWIFYGGARGGGKSLMLSWKAAVRTWEKNDKKNKPNSRVYLESERKKKNNDW